MRFFKIANEGSEKSMKLINYFRSSLFCMLCIYNFHHKINNEVNHKRHIYILCVLISSKCFSFIIRSPGLHRFEAVNTNTRFRNTQNFWSVNIQIILAVNIYLKWVGTIFKQILPFVGAMQTFAIVLNLGLMFVQ